MFNLPTTTQDNLTMTSRQIADLVESRHDNVKTTIERLAERGIIRLPSMQDIKNNQGQTVSEYLICKRDSYVIVAQLSPEFTAKLVDRWQELESKQGFEIPKTLSGALMLAAHPESVQERQPSLSGFHRPPILPRHRARLQGQEG